ncbi:hypothetical protein D3C72_2362780 [compost metagenome]
MDAVGVLEFVHQDIGEAFTVVIEDMRLVQPQLMGAQQQFGKIDQPCTIASLLISLIDPQPGGFHRVAIAFDMLRA